jgi:hypothetical protein
MYIFSHILFEFFFFPINIFKNSTIKIVKDILYGVLDIVCSYSVRLSAILLELQID